MSTGTMRKRTPEEICWIMRRVLNYSDVTKSAHYTFTATVGARGAIRRYLVPRQAKGHFQFVEVKGFFESQFTILGTGVEQAHKVYVAYEDLIAFGKELDSED